jgi:ABC-type phosphate transport system substrate-binding protein
MLRFRLLAALLAVMGSALVTSAQPAYKLVVHPSVSADDVSAAHISKIFLKKVDQWPDGTTAAPVDQRPSSPVRAAFSEAVHGKGVGRVDAYWQKQIFSGRRLPPVTKASDAEVLAFVKANRGAIGYVSPQAPTEGVKVVSAR